MTEYIILKTKDDFRNTMKVYNKDWEIYMWDSFRENTCYIPSENCFVSLDKAKELGFIELI
jgi:hypothetical protein